MAPENPEGWAAILVGLIGASVGLSKILKMYKGDSADSAGYTAVKTTIDSLADEVTRLSLQNEALAVKANEYQLRLFSLGERIFELKEKLSSTRCPSCGHNMSDEVDP